MTALKGLDHSSWLTGARNRWKEKGMLRRDQESRWWDEFEDQRDPWASKSW